MVWLDREAVDAYAARSGILMPTARCFVYLMRTGRYVKVGIADDVEARRDRLQLSSPHEITTTAKYGMGDRIYARLAERATHADLDQYRMHGEWFDVDYHIALESVGWHVAEARKLRKVRVRESKAKYAELCARYQTDKAFRQLVDNE